MQRMRSVLFFLCLAGALFLGMPAAAEDHGAGKADAGNPCNPCNPCAEKGDSDDAELPPVSSEGDDADEEKSED